MSPTAVGAATDEADGKACFGSRITVITQTGDGS
jgi:hypothetical protein